ncbi:hypothetical protein DAPPUDRAFT_242638 [Daphnia pulex]|uniref:Transposable element P transposase-like RNase H domain-containing protein n=1 Tax=Daphnia pulex TaxID=6669 RepID=E9GH44_DAPPU|nr:hypothetical protein DAPPUDRAFT_242638 [Daphnia pulex]|eukprot:EFX81139.1 hypothetical protein DAPPUDRAFT_242638 [Daphnia pulex]
MKKNSKRNVDPEKWQNELDFPNSPQLIKEPDSQETLESNITPEFAADVEMLDPLEYVDEPIVEAVNNLICDPTRAKLPEHWKWCLTDEDLQQDDPVAYSKITAVRFGVCNDFTFPIKMITVVGGEVFYTVKGVLVTPPNFLPKSFSTVEELTDLLARFDSTNICGGFKLELRQEIKDLIKDMSRACESALQDKLSSLNPKEVMTFLSGKPKSMCYGSLVWDEMTIAGDVSFDPMKLVFEGFVDYGEDDGFSEPITLKKHEGELADHALVLIFRPYRYSWIQPIACYATKGACPGGVIHQLMARAITVLHQNGAIVKSVVCDGAQTNKTVMRLCGITVKTVQVKR